MQCCGDAHLLNFGMFAAPDRRLVFDVNDFDETLPASFEWDVKRLATSLAVAAKDNGFSDREAKTAARRCANSYRTEMAQYATMRFLNVWYSRIDIDQVTRLYDSVQSKKAVRRRRRDIKKAQQRTSLKALLKFCDQVGGEYRIRPDHPLIVRFPIERNPGMLDELRSAIAQYKETIPADRREVLRRYYFGDFARKVVGVGSVGTEAFVLLLLGDREDEPLFLQLKEAQESVLAPFAGPSEYKHQGERVARGQRMTQAATDEFLGWTKGIAADGQDSKRLLRAPAAGHEGQHGRPGDGRRAAQLLRPAVRLGAGPRARPDRAGHGDLRLSRREQGLRLRDRRLRARLRRAERQGLPGPDGRGRERPGPGGDGPIRSHAAPAPDRPVITPGPARAGRNGP